MTKHLSSAQLCHFIARGLWGVLLLSSLLQSVNGQQIVCTANSGVPPLVRAEEVAALAGQIVIQCTGGTPTSAGQPVPTVNIQIFANTNITDRLSGTATETSLLIDEPQPGNQVPCTPNLPSCGWTGGVGGPNVFQSTQAGSNSVVFLNVPFDPPGNSGYRIFRIVNIRVNPYQLGVPGELIPTEVDAFISISGTISLPLSNPQLAIAYSSYGIATQLRTPDNTGILPEVEFQTCLGASQQRFATLRFTERYGTAFLPRTAASFVDTETSPPPAAQNVPGQIYNSESGFYNPSFPSLNNLDKMGLADFGTRFRAKFTNVPSGVTLYVGTVPVTFNGGVPTPNGQGQIRARMISTEAGVFSPVTATHTLDGIPAVALPLSGGTAVAIWEVQASNPAALESADFPIWISYSANTSGLGTASVNMQFAPTTVIFSASSSAPLPRFVDSSSALPLLSVVPTCAGAPYTVTTVPSGLSMGVDGKSYQSPESFNWTPGSVHSLSAPSRQTAGSTRFVYTGWSDSGSATHNVTVPATPITYTANYKTQYLLTRSASPVNGGSLFGNPGSVDDYYDSGTAVQLTATPANGFVFASFGGDLAGGTNPQSLVMNGPRSVTAYFNAQSCSFLANPSTLNIPSSGSASISIAITTSAGCFWSASLNSEWMTIQGASMGTGSGNFTIVVAANTTGSQRSGNLVVANLVIPVTQAAGWSPGRVGSYRDGYWSLDVDGDGLASGGGRNFYLGWPGAIPFTGDWNGDGRTKAGVYSNGYWFLDVNGNGIWEPGGTDKQIAFGWSGATPVVGDWNGDGRTKIGIYSAGVWFLDYDGDYTWNPTSSGGPDKVVNWGWTSATPVVGDWNGNKRSKIGVYSGGFWFLDYDGDFAWNPSGADKQVGWGWAGAEIVMGDWNGDGRTKIGVTAGNFYFLDYDGDYVWNPGGADKQVGWGWPGATTVFGDWLGDGRARIGLFNNGQWLLDWDGDYVFSATLDKVYYLGGAGDMPIVGRW